MSGNSTLDPDNLPVLSGQSHGRGHNIGSLGPSDTSDSGSDMKRTSPRKKARGSALPADGEEKDELSDLQNEGGSDTDSHGTGERASVEPDNGNMDGADIDVDHVEFVKPVE